MFGFGVSKDLTQRASHCLVDEEELEKGYDLHSKDLFGANDMDVVVVDSDQQKVRNNKTRSSIGMLDYHHEAAPTTPEQQQKQQEEEKEELIQDDISDSSFEDLEFEKTNLKELNVGKVRNFTENDVVLTILDERFKDGSDLFKSSDSIVLKMNSHAGVDLSKDIRYFKSPYYQMLFGLQQEGSEYKHIVFAHEYSFYVKKYRMASDLADAPQVVSDDNLQIPGAHLVSKYFIGSEQNRCINIQMFILDDSEY